MRPAAAKAELSLLLNYVPGRIGEAVADPYHGDAHHFDGVWSDVEAGA